MRNRRIVALGVAVALLLVAATVAAQTSTTKSLEVTITYEGAGEVDETHRIHVFVFDTPPSPDGLPVGMSSLGENGGSLTFSALYSSPVYVAVVYDDVGGYDPNYVGPPQASAPIGMYADAETGEPAPIELSEEETTAIEIVFDDSVRMRDLSTPQ